MRRQEQTETTVTSTRIRILYNRELNSLIINKMIRIIEPQESALNHSPRGQEAESEEESDLEFEVVDREQIGNELVFQWTRILLLSLFAAIFIMLVASSPRTPKIIVNGISFLRVQTSYELPEAGSLEILVPWDRQESRQELEGLSKLCRQGEISSCWREVLLLDGSIEPQLEQWVLGRAESAIAVVWRESYLLAVLLAALGGARVDVIQAAHDGLDTLRVNIAALGLQKLVDVREQEQLSRFYWQKYSLAITGAEFFSKVIYAELLERAFRIGLTFDSTGIFIHQFTSKTNLLINVANISRQDQETLQKLTNQMTSIANGNKEQQLISVITKANHYVLLDNRLKPQSLSSAQNQSPPSLLPAKSQSPLNREQDLRLKAVWYIQKMSQAQLLSFFKCPSKENPFIQLGFTGQAQIEVVDMEESVSEFLSGSHVYNFIYQYIRSLGGNILLAEEDPILMSLVTMASSASVFISSQVPQKRMGGDMNKKNTQRVRKAALTKSNFQEFIVTNEVSFLIANFDFLSLFEAEIRSCLHLGMHVIVLNKDQEHMQSLLQDFNLQYYLYLIGKASPLSNSCLCDFTSRLYYYSEAMAEDTLLLISSFPIQIERISPREEGASRAIQQISSPCFAAKLASTMNYNLRPNYKTVTISREVSMTIVNDQVGDFIERAKDENALASFLRGNLYADDKLVVVGFQSIGSYALLQATRAVYRKGSLSLINFTVQQLKLIDSFLQENDIVLNYEAQTTSTLDQLELNTPFVLVVPQDILLKERSFIARMPNKSIILTRVQDDAIEEYYDSSQGTAKGYIIGQAARNLDQSPISYQGLACLNYRVDRAKTALLSAGQVWLVILIG